MDKFINGDLLSSIEEFQNQLFTQTDSLTNMSCALIYANIACAEYEMEMYRKCIKSCMSAIVCDKSCIRAYILQGKAYRALSKSDNAIQCWESALELIKSGNIIVDAFHVREIQQLLNSAKTNCSSTNNLISLNSAEQSVNMNNASAKVNGSVENPCQETPSRIHIHADEIDSNRMPNDSLDNTVKSSGNKPTLNIDKDAGFQAMLAMHKQFIGSNGSQINPMILAAVRSKISNASGEDLVDDLIALGYLQVNTGKLVAACDIFQTLLKYRSTLPAAHLGLGSALALSGKFDEAINCFTTAISVDPTISDAWKRRGQTRAAKGIIADALNDLTKATTLDNDPDIYFQRGLVYNQCKNYSFALVDFRKAEMGGINSAQLYNFIGICEGQLGNAELSIEAHHKAFDIDNTFREALLNESQMYKEIANWKKADEGFRQVISLSSSQRPFPPGYWYRSQLLYLLGRPKEALNDILTALTILDKKPDIQYLHFAAICWQAQGYFKQAADYFDRALSIDSDNYCWGQREVVYYIWNSLDRDLDKFCIDQDIDPRIKDGICKKLPVSLLKLGIDSANNRTCQTPVNALYAPLVKPSEISCRMLTEGNDKFEEFLRAIHPISSWIQLNSKGFLPNMRQHTMFGVSVIQMTRLLRRHVASISLNGPGILISDYRTSGSDNNRRPDSPNISEYKSPSASSSSASNNSTGRRGVSNNHIFGWRDFFDIVVTWRQISELNDPVWWIDLLPRQSFEEGYGLQTPIVFGQLKTIRYYSYYAPAYKMVVQMLSSNGYYCADNSKKYLSSTQIRTLRESTTLEELYNMINEDFYVIVQTHSIIPSNNQNACNHREGMHFCDASSGIYEGTRLTILKRDPCGYEFSIRTPSKPDRWIQFDNELAYNFSNLVDLLSELHKSLQNPSLNSDVSDINSVSDKCLESKDLNPILNDATKLPIIDEMKKRQLILKAALQIFYFWVTFSPLTRGTAVCGYAALYSIVLANGYMFVDGIPKDIQLDWEAILTCHVDEFVEKMAPKFELKISTIEINDFDETIDKIKTFRHMLQLLSLSKPSYS